MEESTENREVFTRFDKVKSLPVEGFVEALLAFALELTGDDRWMSDEDKKEIKDEWIAYFKEEAENDKC